MSKRFSVGIDVGTHHIKVVVCERQKGGKPNVIGTGSAKSHGLRYGYIINSGDVSRQLQTALKQAEKTSGIPIKDVYVSMGGVSLESIRSSGSVMVARGDKEVTELDVDRAINSCETNIDDADIINRKILHTIPIRYHIDGNEVLGEPVGMKGDKLSVEALFVTCMQQHLDNLIAAVEETGVRVQDVYASPLAAGAVTLTKAQKIAGCVLANIGSETVSIVVYDNNIPLSVNVFPIGSTDITSDIALGLKVPLDEAEQLKLGSVSGADIPEKKLHEIIVARLTDIFELIESHLTKIGKNGLLPAGIILTGGGSGIATAEDIAKATLELPSERAHLVFPGNKRVRDGSWSVAYGLATLGLINETSSEKFDFIRRTKRGILSWIKQFLP